MSLPSQPASPVALNLGHQKRRSLDSQSSPDSISSYAQDLSHVSPSPPRSRRTNPESSVETSSQEGSSKSSSRTSSSDFAPSTSHKLSSQDKEPISYEVAEVNGDRLKYIKIQSNLVPTGWSNDPIRFHVFCRTFPAAEYAFDRSVFPVLVSDSHHKTPQYLIFSFHKLYFWTPGCDELLYVTELYSLKLILGRMNDNFSGIQTKPLKPLSQHSPPDQLFDHSLWFWQVPKGWSQNVCDLEDLQELVSGCYAYGLPLSVPILVSQGDSGWDGITVYLLKCGEEYYLFSDSTNDLYHIDEPTSLHDILRVLHPDLSEAIKTTLVHPLPEFGGPNVIADKDVPEGWSNRINKDADCGQAFHEHGVYDTYILLFQDGSLNGSSKCLVEEGAVDKYYIWDPTDNEISRIVKAEGLQDILDILKDPSRHLSLSRIARVRLDGYGKMVEEV